MKRHWIAIGCAVIVAILMVAPQLRWHIYPMGSDAESHYLASIQDVQDGNGWGNPFLSDAKSTEYSPYLSVVNYILAAPGIITGISVPILNLIYKALLPAIIFLLIYALFLKFRASRLWGIITAACVVLGYEVFTLSGLFTLGWGSHQFALYARPVNPQLSSILFFAYLLVAYAVFQRYRRRDIALLAVLFGLSFYIYLYTWTWLLMFQGAMILFLIFQKQWRRAVVWLGISGVGVCIGALFLVHLWQVMHSQLYAPFSALMGVVRGHAPHASLLGIIVSGLFLYHFFRQPREAHDYFLLALLVTTWVSINQQVITGVTVQYGHYHWYYNVPVFVFVLFVLASGALPEKYRTFALWGGGTLTVLSLVSTILIQVSSYQFWAPTMARVQQYASAFAWLNEHSPKNSVVLSNEMLSELIPVYTHNDVFWNPYAAYYLLPPGLVDSVVATYLKLDNHGTVPDDQVRELMKPKYAPLRTGSVSNHPDRQIDYVLTDTQRDTWNVGVLGKSHVVFFENGVSIYALHK